jgi:hypothetical protein
MKSSFGSIEGGRKNNDKSFSIRSSENQWGLGLLHDHTVKSHQL